MPRLLVSPWTQQPQGVALQIDWSNPLTRGLMHVIVGGQPNELVSGDVVPGGSNTGTVDIAASKPYAGGSGIPSNAAFGHPYYGISGGIPPDASNWTCLALHTLYAGGTYQTDFTVGWPAETSLGFALGIAFSTATFRPQIAGTNISHAVSLKDNREHLLGVSLGGGTGRAWKDGVQVATAACSTPSFAFVQSYTRFVVGSNTYVANYEVPIGLVLLYSRELSAAEHAQLARNPWQIFAPIVRRVWVPAGGGNVYNESISETASADDATGAVAAFGAAIAEAAAAADASGALLVAMVAVAETASAADAVVAGAGVYTVNIAEAAAAGDAPTAQRILVAASSESAAAADATNWGGASYSVAIAETATLTDAVSAALQAVAAVTEAGAAVETVAAAISAGVAVLEPDSAADLVASAIQTTALLTESANAADVVAFDADNVINAAVEEEAEAMDNIVAVLIDGFLVLTVRPRRVLTAGDMRPTNLAGFKRPANLSGRGR